MSLLALPPSRESGPGLHCDDGVRVDGDGDGGLHCGDGVTGVDGDGDGDGDGAGDDTRRGEGAL